MAPHTLNIASMVIKPFQAALMSLRHGVQAAQGMEMNAAGGVNVARRVQSPAAAGMLAITTAQTPSVRALFSSGASIVTAQMALRYGMKAGVV